ncbi:MAG: hypothetical protein ACYTFW_12790 [Planctomycetota bacterium]|jgi:hypothetical protein
MKRYWIVIIVMVLLILLPLSVYACSTPVFRYAMERWMADYYEGVLIHRGPIAEDDPVVKLLQSETAEFLNLRLSKIDLESTEEEDADTRPAERIKSQLGIEVPETLPALVLWYPWHKGRAAPFWTGEFTPSVIEAWIQSPKRRELAQRLTDGQTAVWIFIESGNADQDKAALQLLNQELETATKQLNEMSVEFPEEAGLPNVSYEFSTLTVSRSDSKEQMLLAMLLNSEPDLHEYADEPIVLPVFGRGRALYALVGEGINADNLQEAIAFLTGPCGCEIKMLNPGVDLLMAVNWDAAVMQFYEEFYVTEEPTPELTSVFPEEPAIIKDTNNLNTPAAPSLQNKTAGDQTLETAPQKHRGLGVIRTTVVSLGGILLVVVLGTLAVSRQRKERP